MDVEAGTAQARGHPTAHRAEPDDTDFAAGHAGPWSLAQAS